MTWIRTFSQRVSLKLVVSAFGVATGVAIALHVMPNGTSTAAGVQWMPNGAPTTAVAVQWMPNRTSTAAVGVQWMPNGAPTTAVAVQWMPNGAPSVLVVKLGIQGADKPSAPSSFSAA